MDVNGTTQFDDASGVVDRVRRARRRTPASRSGLRLVTEGFDTRDLKEAKALLDELNA